MDAEALECVKEAVGSKAAAHVVTKLEAAECITDAHLKAAHRDVLAAAQLVILILILVLILFLFLILKHQKQAAAAEGTDLLPSDYVIQPKVMKRVEKACFVVVDDSKRVGVGVFFRPRVAVTAGHNLKEGQTTVTIICGGILEELHVDEEASKSLPDCAILRSSKGSQPHEFVTCWDPNVDIIKGALDETLRGVRVIVCAFQIAVADQLIEFAPGKIGIMVGHVIRVFHEERHLLFTCNTFVGESGSAIVLWNGKLLGMHQEGANAIRERILRKKTLEERLTAIEQSLDSAVTDAGNCQVGVLSYVFCSCPGSGGRGKSSQSGSMSITSLTLGTPMGDCKTQRVTSLL